ncbi:MAG: ergothioneine biosynthesis protein EgtB [Planctomycetes bacterium]|nr:ergothioneine biosynthesis protein EgtB [Planctomycetota bacterium]
MTTLPTGARVSRERLLEDYALVRMRTMALCDPLEIEDMVVQTMPDVSPTKWHLAHVSWFFEAVVLSRFVPGYEPVDPAYHELFNSYYQALGAPYPRDKRGLVSRPTVRDVIAYRETVDSAVRRLIEDSDEALLNEVASLLEIGMSHEEQHQELLLMDVLHVLAHSPFDPVYRRRTSVESAAKLERAAEKSRFLAFEGDFHEIGAETDGFAYDNERPRHVARVEAFEIADRPVSVADYRAFVEDGGYARPEFWLADGWDVVQRNGWRAPEYWRTTGTPVQAMSLAGVRELDDDEPVCHVSYYEADAYARWAGCRLPTEFEWECASRDVPVDGNLFESGVLHPLPSGPSWFGDVWEWTSSPYAAYPGFVPFEGLLGEYNGKFMVNQFVLRGGCFATPKGHLRRSYRNFYYPHQRWMFAGFRLAKTVAPDASRVALLGARA